MPLSILARSLLAATLLSGTASLPVHAQTTPPPQGSPASAVDPRIGTGGAGHTYPGATVPFGMIQLSPDTAMTDFHHAYAWAAGYQYDDPTIMGFSHTHFSGAGHSDLGDVLVMPIAGDVRLEPGDAAVPESGYRSRFRHATEVETPGYYAVTLDDYKIRAELSASRRVGWHRYTFPKGKPAHLLLDLRPSIYDYPGKVLWARLHVAADGTVSGCRTTRGWAPGRTLCFAMRFSKPMTERTLYNRETKVAYRGFGGPGNHPVDHEAQNGRELEGVFDFGHLQEPLLVKTSISPVSEENAVANLDSEGQGWDFDAQQNTALGAWNKALSVIDMQGTPDQRTQFYTALYHVMLAPTLSMDANGDFTGPDYQRHRADGFEFYSTWSMWDVYRAQQPLLAILRPDMSSHFIRSLIASQQTSPFGLLPVWAYQGLETWCMIGYHAVPVIADAYLAGVRGFDADAALKGMIRSATYGPYGDLTDYMKIGYVPIDKEPEGASKTLEYAYDDWALARMARAMGKTDVARTFEKRSDNWRKVWDPETRFMRARTSSGAFHTPFTPASAAYGSDYTEGNAWQYSWYVPQNIPGLIKVLGGREKFTARIDELFDTKIDPAIFKNVEDISGLIGWYAHGNEPDHHVAYLYDYAGAPWKTQQRLTQIMQTQYALRPDGLAGNDDLGQMSAWYLFTAMGFYPVAPASQEYAIGRPFVSRATMHLGNGHDFTVTADNLDDAHPYVGKMTLNGQPLSTPFLHQQDVLAGGELHFVMQAQPPA
ncbi:GH92 family glycosyl hydrolase [Gluconobacter kondonii]|uniref:GH92 family glycosyl hydrolase n=1 Tax=Gluconobacter kondonii TaxID=941463 RepID=UPI001B8C52B7|nr:GH92 family glycosyl hydrolase [Gluconobacter kondonii]MBS1054694.1 GH92 family glycosyl hydrolase [Gluconobacter kondonii]MBS1057949.1 GH92 family glycosyl hydrolase [Gluconobacter kondonii]